MKIEFNQIAAGVQDNKSDIDSEHFDDFSSESSKEDKTTQEPVKTASVNVQSREQP